MDYVWTLYYETDEDKNQDCFMRAFDSFEKAKEAMRDLFKTVSSKENLFFDGEGNINYLSEYTEDEITEIEEDPSYVNYPEDRIALLKRTPEILKMLFNGEELSEEALMYIRNNKDFQSDGVFRVKDCKQIVFMRSNEFGYTWGTPVDYPGLSAYKNDGKRDGKDDLTYVTMECGTRDKGYFYAKINAFSMEDPGETYYCYIRQTNDYSDDGSFMHIELRRLNVE